MNRPDQISASADASPRTDPRQYAPQLARTNQRPMWDMLSVLFAAHDGTTYFTQSVPGTGSVSADDVPIRGYQLLTPGTTS